MSGVKMTSIGAWRLQEFEAVVDVSARDSNDRVGSFGGLQSAFIRTGSACFER